MRGRVIGAGLVLLGALALWLHLGAEETPRFAANPRPSPIAPTVRPDLAVSPEAPAVPADPPVEAPDDPTRDPPSTRTLAERSASALEQIAAAHAIATQAEVSAYLVKNAELAAETIDEYCEESKKLGGPLFSPSTRARDAGEYMRPLIDWATPERRGALHLPDELVARVTGDGGAWVGTITADDLGRADFSWMRQLMAFDHWTLPPRAPEAGEPFEEVIEIPNYIQLRTWARLRFAQALQTGELAPAIEEVHHLATLVHGHSFVLPAVIGVLLLEVERNAYDVAKLRGLDVGSWSPRTLEDLARARNLERTSGNYLSPGVDPKVALRALGCVPSPCVAIIEASWMHTVAGTFAPEDTSAAFWEIAKVRGDCNTKLIEQIRTAPELPPSRLASAIFSGTNPIERVFRSKK